MPDVYHIFRPLIFKISSEIAHWLSLFVLKLGIIKRRNPLTPQANLKTNVFGLSFKNPLGLAAGYDKNAQVYRALFGLGFGFVEVGTITPKPQTGNPKPRLFRLKKDNAIINRMGFNNLGLSAATQTLKKNSHQTLDGVLGINIGANKDSKDKTNDYVEGVAQMATHADYLVINISSPNTPGLRDLQTTKNLQDLLNSIKPVLAAQNKKPPLLVKVAPDLNNENITDIAEVILTSGVDGLIVSNTTLARPEHLQSPEKHEAGGLSGAPLFDSSTEVLKQFYSHLQGKVPIIGVGGISNGAQAYAKIRAGASLIQLYSALVYEGPNLIHNILEDLSQRLKADGFNNISEAVGKDCK